MVHALLSLSSSTRLLFLFKLLFVNLANQTINTNMVGARVILRVACGGAGASFRVNDWCKFYGLCGSLHAMSASQWQQLLLCCGACSIVFADLFMR